MSRQTGHLIESLFGENPLTELAMNIYPNIIAFDTSTTSNRNKITNLLKSNKEKKKYT